MRKSGMAIPLVLILATILGLVSTAIMKSQQQYNRSNQVSFAQLQSYFVARAGIEHALLKVKYLHRELYDAICLSQGRNPLFDFSLIDDMSQPYSAIKSYNPGPIFLYNSGFTPQGVYTPGFNKNGKELLWLNAFKSDLTSNPVVNPNTLENTTTNMTLDYNSMDTTIKSLMHEPFQKAEYGISELNIAAQETSENSSKVENNAIIEIVIKSTIQTARNEVWDYEIKKTVKISRD